MRIRFQNIRYIDKLTDRQADWLTDFVTQFHICFVSIGAGSKPDELLVPPVGSPHNASQVDHTPIVMPGIVVGGAGSLFNSPSPPSIHQQGHGGQKKRKKSLLPSHPPSSSRASIVFPILASSLFTTAAPQKKFDADQSIGKVWCSCDHALWYISIVKPTKCTSFRVYWILKIYWKAGWFFCPLSGVQDCTYSIRYMSYRLVDCLLAGTVPPSKQSTNLYDIYLMLYIQSGTPDDGRKDRPKHVEWYSVNSKNCASSWFYCRNICKVLYTTGTL